MHQKKLWATLLSTTLLLNSSGTVLADSVTYEEKWGTPVIISLENGNDLTADEFIVQVPKRVKASKESAVNYTVTASGTLQTDHILHVVPNEKVNLT